MLNKIYLYLSFICLIPMATQAQKHLPTKFEDTRGLETVTYQEGISFLETLANQYDFISLTSQGTTDVGKPLHTAILSLDKDFDPKSLKSKGKTILLVNNAIHPGEPDGVDASLMLLRNIAENAELQTLVKNTVVVVIPFYNIGGTLNRSEYSRANQNGPTSYGFRGNAKNLDLNRDFIKCDSKNAKTFTQIFQAWQPDVYIENHVSNGADYQYVITYLATQKDKLGGKLGPYMEDTMIPTLKKDMEDRFPLFPYVNVHGRTPDEGFSQFMDSPRYSSGYATLFHTIGFIIETHMLKPYEPRVKATYDFMEATLKFLDKNGKELQALKKETQERIAKAQDFPLAWELNRDKFTELDFMGYTAETRTSTVTGQDRLFYNRKKPFTKKIPFYNHYESSLTIRKPIAYIIPKAWGKVIERLQLNQVKLSQLAEDQTIEVQSYYIKDFKTYNNPFEGHYVHYQTQVNTKTQNIPFRAGDYVVYVNQASNRYIVEILEPQGPDSFFSWNFFDTILQQKEGFSAYVFEDIAEQLLKENPELKKKFEAKKAEDTAFAQDARQQLTFIYRNSPYYEPEHLRYPIFRLEKETELKLK